MRSPKKEIKRMQPKKAKGNIKPTNSFGGDIIKATEPRKQAAATTTKSKSTKIDAEVLGQAGQALGEAISSMGTGQAPPENYVAKVFASRGAGFKMKYNKNNFPFKK